MLGIEYLMIDVSWYSLRSVSNVFTCAVLIAYIELSHSKSVVSACDTLLFLTEGEWFILSLISLILNYCRSHSISMFDYF